MSQNYIALKLHVSG